MTRLREYQSETTHDVFTAFENYDSALVVLPTGAGKTIVAGEIAQEFDKILWVAHRDGSTGSRYQRC